MIWETRNAPLPEAGGVDGGSWTGRGLRGILLTEQGTCAALPFVWARWVIFRNQPVTVTIGKSWKDLRNCRWGEGSLPLATFYEPEAGTGSPGTQYGHAMGNS